MADKDESSNYIVPAADSKSKALLLRYPISLPDFGSGGKTNQWRLQMPVIDQDKCIKCIICWADCPEATIHRKSDDSVEINYDYCKGCGICANECPTKAIRMVDE